MNRFSALPFSPLIWLAAFVCALYPLNAYQPEWMAAAVLLAALWSYDRLGKSWAARALSMPRSLLPVTLALFWGLGFLSILWSGVPWVSILFAFLLGMLPLTFLTLAHAPFDAREWKAVQIGACVIFAVLALWAIIQFLIFNEFFFGRAKHPLGDPNSLAALFNLALLCVLGAGTLASRARVRWVLLALTWLLVGGLAATGSRGGFFALLGGLLLAAVFCRAFIWQARRWWAAFLIGSVAVIALFSMAPSTDQSMASRVAITVGMQDGSVGGDRFRTMRGAWELTKDNWLTGTGLGTFFLYYPEYRVPEEEDLVTHAHNDPLQFWAEMGVAAPILFYGFLMLAAVATARRAGRLDKADPARARVLFPFIALGMLAAHSHINFNLYNPSILLMAGLVLAYWFDQLELPRRAPLQAPSRRQRLALCAVFAVPLLVYAAMIASERFSARAGDALMAGDIEGYAHNLILADQFGLRANANVYLLAVNMPLTLLAQQGDMLDETQKAELAAQINGNLDAALARNPRSSAAWYFKGTLAQLVPDTVPGIASPQEAFERALRLDPLHIGARVALIDLAVAADDLDRAAALVEGGRRFRMHSTAARDYYQRGIALYAMRGEDDKREEMTMALETFEARVGLSIARHGQTPWTWRQSRTFPQALDSEKE